MRQEVINHFETEDVLNGLEDSEKIKLYKQLDNIVESCRKMLFEMHKDNKKGKLVV
jgi:hypothetical protein